MDKIDKFILRLSRKDALRVQEYMTKLMKGEDANLDIKKLTGHDDVYRLRVQNMRIIFRRNKTGVRIIDVGHRSEKSYKNF